MAGFMLWIRAAWRAWDKTRKQDPNHIRGNEEHVAFDAWLPTFGAT